MLQSNRRNATATVAVNPLPPTNASKPLGDGAPLVSQTLGPLQTQFTAASSSVVNNQYPTGYLYDDFNPQLQQQSIFLQQLAATETLDLWTTAQFELDGLHQQQQQSQQSASHIPTLSIAPTLLDTASFLAMPVDVTTADLMPPTANTGALTVPSVMMDQLVLPAEMGDALDVGMVPSQQQTLDALSTSLDMVASSMSAETPVAVQPTVSNTASKQDALDVEEKRKRSSLASARFRQKKKEREQQLESTLKELQDKCKQQEQRIAELEQETKWLRGLLLERDRPRAS